MQASVARGLAYAPYADMLWMETSTPSLEEAKEFADAIHAKYPGGLLTLMAGTAHACTRQDALC